MVTIDVRRMTQTIGATITVTVTISGTPPYNVQWSRKDGQPLPDRVTIGGDYSLTIEDLQPVDAGIYIVTAVNSIGTSYAEIEIEVLREYFLSLFHLILTSMPWNRILVI